MSRAARVQPARWLLKHAADGERPAVLGIGRRGPSGRAIDLRRGFAGEIARQPAHDPFRDRMRGRQHDHVLLQHGAERFLHARQRRAARRHRLPENFAFAFNRSPDANSWPASSALAGSSAAALRIWPACTSAVSCSIEAGEFFDQCREIVDRLFRFRGAW